MPASRAERGGAPGALVLVALVVSVTCAAPSLYVAWRVLTLGGDLADLFREVRGPLWRTIQLGVLVSLTTSVLGTSLAWLLMRTDVPLARLWRVLAPLPLVFPSFVGAAAFLAGLAPAGVVRQLL